MQRRASVFIGFVMLVVQPDQTCKATVAGSVAHGALVMIMKKDYGSECRNMAKWFSAPQYTGGDSTGPPATTMDSAAQPRITTLCSVDCARTLSRAAIS